ncbi:MAG: hypothetical protein BalsKO_07530 [Balneolaceae bacterium]
MATSENFSKKNLKHRSLEVVTKSGSSPEIRTLLKETIFGTKGKVRYQQRNIEEGINAQKNIKFIQIKKRDQILGTTGVVTRLTSGLEGNIKSLYIRYLSVKNPFRKKEKKRLSQANSVNKKSSSFLKKMIGDEITNHFENPICKSNEKAAFYAFVESENFNSKELCISLGFNPTRKISTLLFSRFYPKKTSSISLVQDSDKDEIRKRLASFYKNHSFYFQDDLFESGTYFVMKEEGKLLAGLRCKTVNWDIVEVPGVSGFFMQNILPYLPFTRKLFNPKNLYFLAFDHIWTSETGSSNIVTLMEHACSDFGIHLGMFWEDSESKLINELKKSKSLGFLHRIKGEVAADVMLRFINMNNQDQTELLKKPVFVSALDMT